MLKRSETRRGRRKLRTASACILFALILVAPQTAYAATGTGWVDAAVTPTRTGGTDQCMEMALLISSTQGEGSYDAYGTPTPGPLKVSNSANLPFVTPQGTYTGRDQTTGECTGPKGAMTGTMSVLVYDSLTDGLEVTCIYTGKVGRGTHPVSGAEGPWIKVEGGPDLGGTGACTGTRINNTPTNFRACGQGDPFSGAKMAYNASNQGTVPAWPTCRTL